MCCGKLKQFVAIFSLICLLSVSIKCDEHAMSSSGSKKTRCATEPNASKKVEKVIKECENDLKIKLIRDTFLILQEEKVNPHHDDQHDYVHDPYNHHHEHYHHADEEEEEDTNEETKKVNLHIVHEPKPSYDYIYNQNDAYTKHYEHYPTEPQSTSSSYENYETKTKYWPYPEEQNKRYWPDRSKRSATHHHIDEDDETWKYNYELDENIHSATILPEDRWIAGCLIHCVLEKNNATDKHGWPTLDGLVAFYTDGVHEHDYFLQTLRFVDHCLKGASHRHGVHRYMLPEKGQNCELSFDVFDCVTDKITEYCSHK